MWSSSLRQFPAGLPDCHDMIDYAEDLAIASSNDEGKKSDPVCVETFNSERWQDLGCGGKANTIR